MRPGPFIALAAVLALSGCATETPTTQAASTPRQCFFTRDVQGFRAVSDSVVMLRVGVNDVYRAELFAPCPDIRFTEGVALRHIGGGSSAICSPLDAELITPSPTGPQTCPLNAIRKLTPQEVAALAPRDRP